MLIKGEKWACEACIRGHRVSNCQHADRPLSHINKKGRPVSQCPHCRGMRKARTTHTKCECGEKPHTKAECPVKETGNNQARKKQCCCSHGTRCTCAAKRDFNLDTVPELGPPRRGAASHLGHRRPHIATTKPEDPLIGFSSPRHSKIRLSDAPKRGVPYSVPRSNTVHVSSGLARRSADHLPLRETGPEQNGVASSDAMTSAPRPIRRVRSEHGSPANTPLLAIEEMNNRIPHLDISLSPFTSNATNPPSTVFDYPDHNLEQFYSPETEGLPETPNFNVPPVDWSTFGISYSPNNVATTFSQPPSYASFDNNNNNNNSSSSSNNANPFTHAGLALSSSGELSEVEDFGLTSNVGISYSCADKLDVHSISDGSEAGIYRLSASSYVNYPQEQVPGSSHNLQSVDIDSFLKTGAALSQPPQSFDIPASTAPRLNNHYSTSQRGNGGSAYPIPVESQGVFTAVDDELVLVSQGGFVGSEPSNFLWDPAAYSVATNGQSGDIPLQQHTQWF
ncbi:hypothetical protein PABG_07429 [Paracoccidioides brasiliensis Pb03]|nr:hypothetical protein PABG_07429 [Paracoccidioides brasiliensis Pb03]